jgi:Heparinase II/III-like protein/Heparinase II/III N-terminus
VRLASADRKPSPEDASLTQLESLRQLPRPEPRLVGSSAGAPTQGELKTGRFIVGGKPLLLRPSVDWRQDPFKSRSWRFQLNTLTWLKPQLLAYAASAERHALASASDLVVDWVTAHAEAKTDNEFAWYDMAVGLRAPYIAFVLRGCLVEELIDDDNAAQLLNMAVRHGEELAKEENYASGHNHGLFQDEGLHLLAEQLPTLPSAASWANLAKSRVQSTLSQTISRRDGGHLEHSSSYQFSITSLVSRLAENIPGLSDLVELRDRLKATSQWHVTPADRIAQLGDTDDTQAPSWARVGARSLRGMNALLDTGQAFIRDGDSYLAVTAAYHSAAHKQADETSFILVEGGSTLIGDTGRWGYYEDEPDRRFARSAAAHNVVLVDDDDFQWAGSAPYGSGLVAAGHSDSWYGILVENPTLRRQGVTHRRWLLYQPKHALLIIDDVQADESHEYVRYFHFGPAVAAELHHSGIALSADHVSATLADIDANTSISLHRGVDSPRRMGWTYPGDRIRTPTFTAVLRTSAVHGPLVASVAIGEDGERLSEIAKIPGGLHLRLTSGRSLTASLSKHANSIEIMLGEKSL